MTLSSLQQQALVASKSSSITTDAKHNTNNNNSHSFESCFSAGLDLTEFATSGSSSGVIANNNNSVVVVAASAELAQQKINAAARRNREEKEEAALEQRVANVVVNTSTKSTVDQELGSCVPRALNPNNDTNNTIMGKERHDNFVQFDTTGAYFGNNNEFLSSLVSNHQSEGRQETISHKSRTLLLKSSKNQIKKQIKLGASSSSSRGGKKSFKKQQQQQQQSPKNNSGRKVSAAKKSRKSKY